MKLAHTIVLLLASAIAAVAQNNPFAVKGQVLAQKVALQGATVALLTIDSTVQAQVATGADGFFALQAPAAGNYLVKVSATGYATYFSAPVQVSAANPVRTLAPIALAPAANKLADVVVVGRKPLFEQKSDRMIVNVDASPANEGTTAMDVLERSPGVTVDKDGNISLKGKNNVMVMVDGKPTFLSNADLANLLRSMPSSQLDQLEIMTNPPAKYDAAGNAGIINIKTKKSKARGFNGSITTGVGAGRMWRSNNSVQLNYRKNKVNLFANYSYNYNEWIQDMEIGRRFTNAGTGALLSTFDQVNVMESYRRTQTAKVGMDYYASKKTTLGVVLTGIYTPTEFYGDNTTFIKDPTGDLQTRMNAAVNNTTRLKNGGVNLNFRHQIDSTGREITADADYLGYDIGNTQGLSSFFFDKNGNPSAPAELIRGQLPSNIEIYSARVDYVHPLRNKMKLEAGAKSSWVNTDNVALFEEWHADSWRPDAGRSNQFDYYENINALYVNAQKQLNPKWSAQLGLRMENTIARGQQVTTGEQFDRNYTQLFPTAYAAYKASDNNQFTLSYGRRIQRPNYQDMNPFYFFLDKYTFQVGNPWLQPQFSHNIDLSHTFKGFLTTTLNYTNTRNIIDQLLEQDDATNTTFVRMGNIARQEQIGLSVAGGVPVTKWWNANVFLNVFHNQFEGNVSGTDVELGATSFVGNVQNIFRFKKGWGGELSGFYRSKSQEGVFTARSMAQLSLAGSKQIMQGKGTLRLTIRDPFNWQYFRGAAKYGTVDVNVQNRWDNRTAYVSFTYRFGKVAQQQAQARKRTGGPDEQSRVKMD